MRSLSVSRGGKFFTDLPENSIGRVLRDPRAVLWLDITGPVSEDQTFLRAQFGFHPLAIEDAVRAHERPKVDAYGGPTDYNGDGVPDSPAETTDYLAAETLPIPVEPSAAANTGTTVHQGYYFVVFYAAEYDTRTDDLRTSAVSLFIGPNYLVTVHDQPIPQITETLLRWRTPGNPLGQRVGGVVHALLDAMVDEYFPLMDKVADRVEDLEDAIFTHFQERSIHTIFRLKKDLLAMRRVVAPERDVLNVLLRRQLPIFSDEDEAYLQDVYDHIVRVTDSIDTYRDLVSSALDSYLSLQSNKLNVIVKTLTIGSIVLMSCALVAGIYGMNFDFMPELRQPWGYPFALGVMALISAGLICFFRWRKWL